MKNYFYKKNFYFRNFYVHPSKFLLWLFIVTIIMMFIALTSAYIVKKSHGDWFNFDLPFLLWLNSFIIFLSSIFIQFSYFFLKKKKFFLFYFFLIFTLFLSFFFLFGQYNVWLNLMSQNVYFSGNPSGSFFYVFTGLHAIHLIIGIFSIIFILVYCLLNFKKKIFYLKMCATYWHFLGLLWIYLFLFLILNH